jgi:UPF0271 protein
MTTIDLNCDLGEGAGHDAALMPLVTSANIACGGHAGDDDTMRATVELARRHGVAIGAHPGHRDRLHVGRIALPLTPVDATRLIHDQIADLAAIAGDDLVHVKLHGALYHQVATDPALAAAFVGVIATTWPRLAIVAPAASLLVGVARSQGLLVAEEAFADRGYGDDGRLIARAAPGGVIGDPQAAAEQAVLIAREQRVRTMSGRLVDLRADTLCLHGDGPDPRATAHEVRRALAAAGITARAFSATTAT